MYSHASKYTGFTAYQWRLICDPSFYVRDVDDADGLRLALKHETRNKQMMYRVYLNDRHHTYHDRFVTIFAGTTVDGIGLSVSYFKKKPMTADSWISMQIWVEKSQANKPRINRNFSLFRLNWCWWHCLLTNLHKKVQLWHFSVWWIIHFYSFGSSEGSSDQRFYETCI